MPKRYFKYYLTAITVISFIACSEKDTLNGEGMLHLKVGVTDQVKVTTRSMTDELQDSLQRHCTISILNEKGTVRRYKGVNELPEALYLSAGSYTALVTAGDSVPASFETVYYKEERPFHINSGEVTNLELTCGIANTVVAVKYDEALSSVFQTYDKVGIVLPLASLRVAATIVHGDAKGQNLGSAGGGAQLGIAGEVTGDVHSIDAHNSLLPLGAQAQSKTTVLLLVVATDDHVADHSVGDAQDAIKLGDLGRICVEVDEGVVTIGEVVDLVGELALAPLVNGVDLASALSDRGIDTLHNSETSLGVERRVNKEQQFISLHIVTSSGQMWLQVVKVRLKQEKTW